MKSLQGWMLLVVGATISLCWAGALTVLVIYLTHSQTSIWDDKLQAIATRILLTIPAQKELRGFSPEGRLPGLQLRGNVLAHEEKLAFQVWTDRSRLIARTPDAPTVPLKPDLVEGFASLMIDGHRWRVYSVSDSTGKVYVQVGNLHSVIDGELQKEAFIALGLGTLLLALVGALMWCAVRRSLEPVVALQTALRRRQKFDLTPLPSAPLPTELRPLVDSFNHLLEQLDEAVEGERRFIGDAAHELRTPLSALQAQAQVALRAHSVADKDAALVKLLAVAQRSTRLSEQLLDLARLNAGLHASHQSIADLSELVLHVIHEFDIHAQQQQRAIVLATTPCRIACDVDEIGILLRNLLDNALRYTNEGGRVQMGCWQRSAGGVEEVVLEVSDDGPGVPEAEYQAVFQRFHRVAGNGGRGSGIGLSLVAGIAHLHDARIETGPGLDGRGFSVRVLFPVPPSLAGSPAHNAASSKAVQVADAHGRRARTVDQRAVLDAAAQAGRAQI